MPGPKPPEIKLTSLLKQILEKISRRYTSHGHKLRFFKSLKMQGDQRIKRGLMPGVGFTQARHNRGLESREVRVVLGVQTLLFDKFPQPLYKTNRMLRKQEVIQNDSCG